jgi:hypothetical protein
MLRLMEQGITTLGVPRLLAPLAPRVDTYMHMAEDMDQEAAERMAALFS